MNNPKNAAMQKPKLKRFYKEVAVSLDDSGWHVTLDGRNMRTPAKELLVLPTQKLAEAVAAEWRRQGEFVELDDMYHMQFSCAAIDYTRGYRADVESEAAAYITTDLLCYRATEPQGLVQRQSEGWNRWLDWAQTEQGLTMVTVLGIMPAPQPPETLQAVDEKIATLDDFALTALWLAAKHTGSLVLGFAVLNQALMAKEAFVLSRIEEDYQNEQWGIDDEARIRRASAAAEMTALGEFVSLIQ